MRPSHTPDPYTTLFRSHNPNNERIKRRYFAYLKEAKRHSEPTVDAVAKALARVETDTKHREFKAMHFEQAIAFKRHLADQRGQRSGERLSKATLNATLAHARSLHDALPISQPQQRTDQASVLRLPEGSQAPQRADGGRGRK